MLHLLKASPSRFFQEEMAAGYIQSHSVHKKNKNLCASHGALRPWIAHCLKQFCNSCPSPPWCQFLTSTSAAANHPLVTYWKNQIRVRVFLVSFRPLEESLTGNTFPGLGVMNTIIWRLLSRKTKYRIQPIVGLNPGPSKEKKRCNRCSIR